MHDFPSSGVNVTLPHLSSEQLFGLHASGPIVRVLPIGVIYIVPALISNLITSWTQRSFELSIVSPSLSSLSLIVFSVSTEHLIDPSLYISSARTSVVSNTRESGAANKRHATRTIRTRITFNCSAE